MRHFYKSHGKHCYLRSFQTKCSKCGADVLYWECRHGSKVFFNYPPYGKLVRHYCRYSTANLKNKTRYPVIVKTPKGLLEKESPSCPLCGKLFKNLKNLNDHINTLQKQDDLHKNFHENQLDFDFGYHGKREKTLHQKKISYKPKFGKINLKKRIKSAVSMFSINF